MLRFTSSNYNFVSECRSSVIIVIFSWIYKAIRVRIGLDLPCSVIGAGLTALGHYWLSLVFFSFLLAVLVSPGLPFWHSNHDAHSKFVFTSMRLNFFSQHFCFLGFWTGSTVSIMNYWSHFCACYITLLTMRRPITWTLITWPCVWLPACFGRQKVPAFPPPSNQTQCRQWFSLLLNTVWLSWEIK